MFDEFDGLESSRLSIYGYIIFYAEIQAQLAQTANYDIMRLLFKPCRAPRCTASETK